MTNPLSTGEWLRRPAHALVDDERVRFTTSPGTDLWQRTYYGFRTDNAPALLLPGIPGIETAEEQVYLTKRKAFIRADEAVKLYRFEAEVLK